MKKMLKNKILFGAATILCIGAAIGGAYYKSTYKLPLKEYTAASLYMAVLDDEISRMELIGAEINGTAIIFPSRKESLQYRYHLFLELNKGKTQAELNEEIAAMEQRLQNAADPLTQKDILLPGMSALLAKLDFLLPQAASEAGVSINFFVKQELKGGRYYYEAHAGDNIYCFEIDTQSEATEEISFSLYRISKGNTERELIKVYTQ